ncbi:MAG: ATP-binding protein [Acidimicrobiales bacterium]|nr:ATP-binding protein [Acidimicrobiales bacterium]
MKRDGDVPAHRAWAELGRALLADPVDLEAVSQRRAAFRASLELDVPFSIVAANAWLDPDEAEVLAVLCAAEMEPGAGRLTLGELARIAAEKGAPVLAVSPQSRLIGAALIKVGAEGRWAARPVSVAPAVCWALIGDPSQDPDLGPDLRLLQAPLDEVAQWRRLLVVGADRERRRQCALANAAGLRFLIGPPPEDEAGWAALVREATLRGAGIVVELEEPPDRLARRWLQAAGHLTWVLSSTVELALDTVPEDVWRELTAPDTTTTPHEWERAIGDPHASAHGLTAEQLRLVARAHAMVGGDIDAAVRRLASGAIDQLARRIRPRRGWEDLVVPAERRALLGDIALRYRGREQVLDRWGHRGRKGRGVIALFHGPSGTGKTLSAEIVARELGLDLFAIDLAAVVSKYIGETEKNLEQIFRAAASGRVVLLFDEADAIVGERSKTQDAHDLYANLEVSYLLQRIEAYDGVAILTTNLMNNIDQAFLRRIDVAVEFTLPDEAERRALWHGGFPPGAPRDGVDVEFLARRFKLPGGAIHNVALTAAFLAADAQTPITMELVMAAMGREYAKMGRLRTAEEFGPYVDR